MRKALTHEINSVASYIEKLSVIGSKKRHLFFRGHKDKDYKIQPSVFRPDLKVKKSESEILRELMTYQPDEFIGHRSAFESLVHAQHHGLPTRLLDVSFSSIAALYFAAEADENGADTKDGCVIRFDVSESRIKGFDSDALSCICNLAKLNFDEQEEIRAYITLKRERKVRVKNLLVDEFNDLGSVRRLVQYVKQEKPYFENRVMPIDLFQNYLALPVRNNKRVNAQSGAFIVSGVLTNLAQSPRFAIEKFIISKKRKKFFREELDGMGINRMTMFPDLQSSARYIIEKRQLQKT